MLSHCTFIQVKFIHGTEYRTFLKPLPLKPLVRKVIQIFFNSFSNGSSVSNVDI